MRGRNEIVFCAAILWLGIVIVQWSWSGLSLQEWAAADQAACLMSMSHTCPAHLVWYVSHIIVMEALRGPNCSLEYPFLELIVRWFLSGNFWIIATSLNSVGCRIWDSAMQYIIFERCPGFLSHQVVSELMAYKTHVCCQLWEGLPPVEFTGVSFF